MRFFCAGIMPAMRTLYHIQRICYLSEGCALAALVFWLPSGACRSAQVSCPLCVYYTIWAESGGDRLGIDKRKGPDFQFFPENRAVKI